jgi:hypothetical protein
LTVPSMKINPGSDNSGASTVFISTIHLKAGLSRVSDLSNGKSLSDTRIVEV